MAKLLTKSNYLLGLQCPKLLWVTKNDKQRLPEHDEITLKKFSDGHILGELATKVFPEGQDIPDDNFMENLRNTKKLISKRIPLFEPAFMIDSLYSRADVLVPVGEDEWDIVEVKSATRVKETNLHDVAFQKYVYEKAGLKIRKCFLMHINNQYVRDGEIEPSELFVQTEISEKVEEFSEGLEFRIEEMSKIINSREEPNCKIGFNCSNPYDCPIKDECWKDVPEDSVFDFYRMLKKKTFELYDSGIVKLNDVPENVKLNDKQQIQRRLAFDGGKHINKLQVKNFLESLKYPVYYLDFETINPAIPKFDGMRPYQRIPFQFSLHVQEEESGELRHVSFLAEGMSDPRPKFMQSLKDNLGEKGSILVYNQGFEKGVMNECSGALPEFREWYDENIFTRIKDLWDVFKDFSYYDPKQEGSTSIKYVLPVLSDLSYDKMDIKDGALASLKYERMTYGDVEEAERLKARRALERYCELDTLAEVEIIKGLKNKIK
ncbi:DUF2779 domain-containing protein [archaeon]|nr:DUF2779 domain-containing protein [archaeon]